MLRERFGIYTDGTCPPGSTMNSPLTANAWPCTKTDGTRGVLHTCASGKALIITTSSREVAAVCVPETTTLYPLLNVGPYDFPCNAGDYIGTEEAGMTCVPAGAPPATTTPSGSVEDLNTQYAALKSSYDALVAQTVADPSKLQTVLPQIQTINQRMAALLDQMLTQLQHASDGPNSEAFRTKLTETLARIQMDYNGLKTNTDALQTLKRIRSFQDTSWQPMLSLYLGLFLFFGIVLVLVMLFRRQTKVSTPAPMASAPAMPSFT